MARKEVTTYEITDDLTGESLTENEVNTVEFSYNGATYSLDLSDANVQKLQDALAPFVEAGRKVSRSSRSKAAPRKAAVDNNAVREWAAKKNITVSPRGRVAQSVIDAYLEDTKG